jgi:hypothetical protein
LYAIVAFEGYIYVCMFEKIGDFPDFWAVVRECSLFVLSSLRVSLLFCGCIVAFYLFSECYYFSGWEVVIVGYPEYGLPFCCPVFSFSGNLLIWPKYGYL